MTARYYRLDGSPYPEGIEGLLEWGRDLEDTRGRIVGQTHLWTGMLVSTVWLGIDHGMGNNCPPLIFETMVFDDTRTGHPDIGCWRWPSLEIASQAHDRICRQYGGVRYVIRRMWFQLMDHYFNEDHYDDFAQATG